MNMLKWQQTQQQHGHLATLVEAALMVETGSYRMYDAIVPPVRQIPNCPDS